MSQATLRKPPSTTEVVPSELVELMDRIQAQPAEVRVELQPLVDDVLEQARFRGRILSVAREALEQLRLDLEMARFDLEATRRERENLRRLIHDQT